MDEDDRSTSPTWKVSAERYLKGVIGLEELYRAARRPLNSIIARLAPDLAPDLREDVVQQVFVRLLENPPRYDRGNCNVSTFLYGLLRNAVRHVRATFAAPGRRTRQSRKGFEEQSTLGASIAEIEDPVTRADASRLHSLDTIGSPRWTADNVEASNVVREILRKLPADAAIAAWLVLGLEFSVIEAAAKLGKSRFAIARSLTQTRRNVKLMTSEVARDNHRRRDLRKNLRPTSRHRDNAEWPLALAS